MTEHRHVLRIEQRPRVPHREPLLRAPPEHHGQRHVGGLPGRGGPPVEAVHVAVDEAEPEPLAGRSPDRGDRSGQHAAVAAGHERPAVLVDRCAHCLLQRAVDLDDAAEPITPLSGSRLGSSIRGPTSPASSASNAAASPAARSAPGPSSSPRARPEQSTGAPISRQGCLDAVHRAVSEPEARLDASRPCAARRRHRLHADEHPLGEPSAASGSPNSSDASAASRSVRAARSCLVAAR